MAVAERLPKREDPTGGGHRLERVARRSQDRLIDAGSDVGVVTRRAARKARRRAKGRVADATADVGVVTRRAARKARRRAKGRGRVLRLGAVLIAATASIAGAVAWWLRSRRGSETSEESPAERPEISQPYTERRAS